nr:uncharacterized protein CTRU02_15783 [Colletotrichum truncatum]KAF6780658.1 hypothetical protein CTRU02_15783 [Colletotrichum truncatum]
MDAENVVKQSTTSSSSYGKQAFPSKDETLTSQFDGAAPPAFKRGSIEQSIALLVYHAYQDLPNIPGNLVGLISAGVGSYNDPMPLNEGGTPDNEWFVKLLRVSLALAEDSVRGDKFQCPLINAAAALCIEPSGIKHPTVAGKGLSGIIACMKAVFVTWGAWETANQNITNDRYNLSYHQYVRPNLMFYSSRTGFHNTTEYIPDNAFVWVYRIRNIALEESMITPGMTTTTLRDNGCIAVFGANSEIRIPVA